MEKNFLVDKMSLNFRVHFRVHLCALFYKNRFYNLKMNFSFYNQKTQQPCGFETTFRLTTELL